MSLSATADGKRASRRGDGGGLVLDIATDPRCDKRVLSQDILKDCTNKEGPAGGFDLTSGYGYWYLKS